jgi:hypothetical protein
VTPSAGTVLSRWRAVAFALGSVMPLSDEAGRVAPSLVFERRGKRFLFATGDVAFRSRLRPAIPA